MILFDSHCHLDDRSYDEDRDEVIHRAGQAGVSKMMIVGTGVASSKRAIALAEARSGLYAAVGLHPHDAKSGSGESLDLMVHLARNPVVKAWGEIGLDFNRMFSTEADQETWFRRQLDAALSLDLPVIFHERDTNGRLLAILAEYSGTGLTGVIHCFSGSGAELESYLDLGLCIGVTGILTHKQRGASLRDLITAVPEDRLLVETDAPYLTPSPERNKARRNEPAFVRTVLLKLAEVRKVDPECLAANIWHNTGSLYHVD
jgi:TatD DNase family protein